MAKQARKHTRRGAELSTARSRRTRSSGAPVLAGLAIAVLATSGLLVAVAGIAGAAPDQVTGPTTTTPSAPPTTAATTPTTAAPAPTPTTAATTPPTVATAPKSAPAPAPTSVSSESRITPIIECTFVDEKTKRTSTVWGYQNRGTALTVPIGDRNHFDNPKPAKGDPEGDVGQPTEFKAGRDKNVFVVTADGESTWTLTGNEVTSPAEKADACKTNPVPIVSTGLGGLVALAVVTGVMSLVLFWRLRRPRA